MFDKKSQIVCSHSTKLNWTEKNQTEPGNIDQITYMCMSGMCASIDAYLGLSSCIRNTTHRDTAIKRQKSHHPISMEFIWWSIECIKYMYIERLVI